MFKKGTRGDGTINRELARKRGLRAGELDILVG